MEEYCRRVARVDRAIALETPDRVPLVPFISALPFFLTKDVTYRDAMYDFPKAAAAVCEFYGTFLPDATTGPTLTSGRANEMAGSTMIDWPGRPGPAVPDYSTHQCFETEYLLAEEYPELLRDFTGFMLRKYIPRAFPGVKGLESIQFAPSIVLNTGAFSGLYAPQALAAYARLGEIAQCDGAAEVANAQLRKSLAALGLPPLSAASAEAPFDVLSDYFRGTMGAFEDLIERPDMIARACDLFADLQIEGFRALAVQELPVRRVHFPMHKGMDGFMSPQQYEQLYWKPLRKMVLALIELGITPILYTEGQYDTRLEQLADVPRGKVLYHFEKADMARAKQVLGGVACISGNFPVYLLEWGTQQEVRDAAKRLIDICAPGGGYIFDTDCGVENAKRENVEALFETVMSYGTY